MTKDLGVAAKVVGNCSTGKLRLQNFNPGILRGVTIVNDWAAKNSYLDAEDEIQCECGCLFKVWIFKQNGHNEREDYYCPDCKKEYSAIASLPPRVMKVGSESSNR